MSNQKQTTQKYLERYRLGVISRDNSLEQYNYFLQTMGEKKSLEEIVSKIIIEKEKCRILDLGCGNAQALLEIKEKFSETVFTAGIDLIPAKTKIDVFIEGNIHEVIFPKEMDIIISFRALHEMGFVEKIIPKITQSLSSGGRAYLWLRIREVITGESLFTGEMNEKEEAYLLQLSSQRELENVRILAQPVYEPIPIHSANSKKKSVITGFTIVMMKKIAMIKKNNVIKKEVVSQ